MVETIKRMRKRSRRGAHPSLRKAFLHISHTIRRYSPHRASVLPYMHRRATSVWQRGVVADPPPLVSGPTD